MNGEADFLARRPSWSLRNSGSAANRYFAARICNNSTRCGTRWAKRVDATGVQGIDRQSHGYVARGVSDGPNDGTLAP
jgi:hypothetical protein